MKNRKGIILAGGTGSRLYPLTLAVSKQVMPVYDKPMIYYPLAVLMQANIREVLIITTPRDSETFKDLLGDGSQWGMHFEYKIQEKANGLAEAFIIGEDFIGEDNVAMILGDNMFYGERLAEKLKQATEREKESTIFGYYVKDPRAYGVVEIDESGSAISIEEKPKEPKSNYAVTGLYYYPKGVAKKAKEVKPSARGELEITSLNQMYLEEGILDVTLLGRGFTWLDTGTTDSLNEASNFVQLMQTHQGIVMSCLEEIAYKRGWITKEQVLEAANLMKNNDYGKHLFNVANNKIMY